MTVDMTAPAHWAHIDETGKICLWGTCQPGDLFSQPLKAGLIAVARPAHVTGYEPYRYVDGAWIKDEP